MAALEKEPEVGKIVLGDDIQAFNELMKSVYEVSAAVAGLRHCYTRMHCIRSQAYRLSQPTQACVASATCSAAVCASVFAGREEAF